MNRNLWQTTTGENVWLRRKSRDETAENFAKSVGIGRTTLWKIERGKDGATARGLNLPDHGALGEVGLLCALARRRSGMGLPDVEAAMGRSRPTVLALEKAGAAEMVAFWRSRGFRFPG